MSDFSVLRSQRERAPPVPQLDAALDRMLARLRDTLHEHGHPEAAERLNQEIIGTPEPPDGSVLGLPFAPLQAVDRLVSALSLGSTDADLLVLALLSHRYAGAAAALRELHPEALPWPTVGLASAMARADRIAGADSWSDLVRALASSSLLAAGALLIDGPGPMSEHSLRPAELVWEALTGIGGWPSGLTVDPLPAPSSGLDHWYENPLIAAARSSIGAGTATAFCAVSDRPDNAAARLAALVNTAGRRPVILRARTLSSDLVQRALVLAVTRDLVPVFCEREGTNAPLELIVPYIGLPLLVARASGTVTTWPRPLIPIPVSALSLPDRESALHAAVGGIELGESAAPATADPRDLELAAADLLGHLTVAGRVPRSAARQVFLDAVDRRTQGSLPPGGYLSHPQRSWDSLVLSDDRMSLLHEAVDRARIQAEWDELGTHPPTRRGDRGLRLLFSGPPGTGKTLAAEVMARALGRDILGINLARLVSKWIGETEKNLEVVFDAAERGDVLLFFDEADAVFAKRSEVSDARDRYANLETAYLLGRIEAFSGVVVLATNLRRNIDSAFARRLEFIVPFDPPDADARRQLWELHTPSWAELAEDVSTSELASLYDLSGALIRNAATAAAYLAVSHQAAGPSANGLPQVTTEHLVHAIEREHSKAGLAFPGPPHTLRLVRAAAATSVPAGRRTRNKTQTQGRQS